MIFDSKYYPKIMFLAIIVMTLLLLFNMVNIMDNIKINLDKKSAGVQSGIGTGTGITGFASDIDNNNNYNNPENSLSNQTNSTGQGQNQEMYTTTSYAIYYILIIGVIAAIFIIFSVLRSTIMKNIEIEEEARRL